MSGLWEGMRAFAHAWLGRLRNWRQRRRSVGHLAESLGASSKLKMDRAAQDSTAASAGVREATARRSEAADPLRQAVSDLIRNMNARTSKPP